MRRTSDGRLRIDKAAIAREEKLDGKWLLRTRDDSLTPDRPRRRLQAAARGRARLAGHEGLARLRPVFHHREDRIRAHVQLCWLALLLIRVIENATGDTWRNVRHELDRMHLVTMETARGRVAQRSHDHAGQARSSPPSSFPEPGRFLDFELARPQADRSRLRLAVVTRRSPAVRCAFSLLRPLSRARRVPIICGSPVREAACIYAPRGPRSSGGCQRKLGKTRRLGELEPGEDGALRAS